MDNKTIILTTLNAAWSSPGSVIDLFIDSFRHGVRTSSLLKHLVIIAFDRKAYRRCTEIHTYCYALVTGNVDFSQEKRFLTAGYLEMMWKRLDFLRLVLEKGYSFIFSVNFHVYFTSCSIALIFYFDTNTIRCILFLKIANLKKSNR